MPFLSIEKDHQGCVGREFAKVFSKHADFIYSLGCIQLEVHI
jgi:hypothetical protein